jgi:hypothetical protein
MAILIDFVHVIEYLWGAAWCFFSEGDTAAEDWVRDRALAVLEGHARAVASGIRRRATAERLAKAKRNKAEEAARYLKNKAPYLDYPKALSAGWPIATGVIEADSQRRGHPHDHHRADDWPVRRLVFVPLGLDPRWCRHQFRPDRSPRSPVSSTSVRTLPMAMR